MCTPESVHVKRSQTCVDTVGRFASWSNITLRPAGRSGVHHQVWKGAQILGQIGVGQHTYFLLHGMTPLLTGKEAQTVLFLSTFTIRVLSSKCTQQMYVDGLSTTYTVFCLITQRPHLCLQLSNIMIKCPTALTYKVNVSMIYFPMNYNVRVYILWANSTKFYVTVSF